MSSGWAVGATAFEWPQVPALATATGSQFFREPEEQAAAAASQPGPAAEGGGGHGSWGNGRG